MEKLRARDYRRMASNACATFSGTLAILALLYYAISAVFSYVGCGIVTFIFGGTLYLGYLLIIKKAISNVEPEARDLFSGFGNNLGESVVTYVLQNIYIILWTLLLIIPGIIKSYSYACALYLIEDEGLSGNAAITRSREIMNGHKWELFCLQLSYIGWLILCCLTFGILFLWVGPKMEAAQYMFYRHITGKDQVEEVTEQVTE